MSKYCKSSGEWNISRRRFDRQRGEKLTRTSSTKVRVFRKLSKTSEQWLERVEVLRKVETVETTSATRRATRGVKQNKARKIETETNLPRTERLEVLSKTKQERSRQSSQLNNEQSDSRCWANQSKKDWDGDMSTMSRATRGVRQNKARKIEMETNLPQTERLEVLSKTKQKTSRQSSEVNN